MENFPAYRQWNGCAVKTQGEVWKQTGRSSGVYGGVQLGFVGLNTRSGYDQGTRMKFTITQSSEICGDDPNGWGNASAVEIHHY